MDMLSLKLEKTSIIPLYEQLYSFIKAEIINGNIPYKTRLPSKRKLALFLELSQTTIETAYDQLVAEGYVEAAARRGYFAALKSDLFNFSKEEELLNYNFFSKKEQSSQFRYDLNPDLIDSSVFPKKVWQKLYREAIADFDFFQLGHPQGELTLRKEIARYLYYSRGVICSPDQILIGSGTEQLFALLIGVMGNSAIFGIENPGYPLPWKALESFHKKCIPIDIDQKGIKVDSLEKTAVNTVYVTPSHQFPSGGVMSVNRRAQLLNWVRNSESNYIIEDDYDSEFRYHTRPIPSLNSMDGGENVVYISTFSKSLFPSLRIGYMVLPMRILDRYNESLAFYSSSVSRLDQEILARFISGGFFEKHLNRMRKIYRRKHDLLLQLLEPYENQLIVSGQSAGFHVILEVKNGMSDAQLIESAKLANIKVYSFSDSYFEQKPDFCSKLMLGFSGLAEAELTEAIKNLICIWNIKG